MKNNYIKIFLWLSLGLSLGSLTCCKGKYDDKFERKTLYIPHRERAKITFPKAGDSKEITVKTNVDGKNWKVETNAPSWVKLEKKQASVIISCDENPNKTSRYAKVKIYYGHQGSEIELVQYGITPEVLVENEKANPNDYAKGEFKGYTAKAKGTGQELQLSVKSNFVIDRVQIPDTSAWVTFLQDKAASDKITFKLDPNYSSKKRASTIILSSKELYTFEKKMRIEQENYGNYVTIDGDKTKFDIIAAGGEITIPLLTNAKQGEMFEVNIPTNVDWITKGEAEKGKKVGDLFKYSQKLNIMSSTKTDGPRTAEITFKSKNSTNANEVKVTIEQAAFVEVAPNNVVNLKATPGHGEIVLSWGKPAEVNYTKIEVTYSVDSEQKKQELSNDATSLTISNLKAKSGEIEFVFKTYGPTNKVTDKQVTIKATCLPVEKKFELKKEMISSNASDSQEGKNLGLLIDGKADTYWHSDWHNTKNTHGAHYLLFSLDREVTKVAIAFQNRDRTNGEPVEFNVEVAGDDNNFTSLYEFKDSHEGKPYTQIPTGASTKWKSHIMVADKPFKKLKFTPQKMGANKAAYNSQWYFNLAEFEIFTYDEKD